MKIQRIGKLTCWLVLMALLVPASAVLADGEAPPDPGAGGGQDEMIGNTVIWSVNPDELFYFYDSDFLVALNWGTLDGAALDEGLSEVNFTGTSETIVFWSDDGCYCWEYTCYIGGSTEEECKDAWVVPGQISLVAMKDAPDNAVIVSQDPNNTGVDLSWVLRVEPTVFHYEVWEQIPYEDENPGAGHCKHKNAECKINQSGKPCCPGLVCVPFNPHSGNGKCRVDESLLEWQCVEKTQSYQESVVAVNPSAVLTLPSKNWITGELSMAYPGANLYHPVWGFNAGTPSCFWEGDVCVWTHSEGEVQVMDPGNYDLGVSGMTSGTAISPPRNFNLVGGQFGVYLIDFAMTSLTP